MRIVMIGTGTNTIPPQKGVCAVELIEYNIAKELTKSGHKISIITIKPGLKNINNVKFERVTPFRTQLFGKFSLILSDIIFSFFAFLKAIKLRKETDVFHVHTVIQGFFFIIGRIFLKKPIIYTCHNPDWNTYEKLPLPNRIIKRFEAFVIKHSDMATTPSEQVKKNQSLIRKDIIVIHNFIDPDFFKKNTKSNFKEAHFIPKENKVISFTGKLTKNKGVDLLLKAAREVISRNKKVTFVFAGPTTLEGDQNNPWKIIAEKYGIKNNIIFTGAISQKELVDLLSVSDIHVHPSQKEIATSVAVLEAMAIGLPIVASDIPGMNVAVDSTNGFLIQKRNYINLARKIEILIRDSALRKKMGVASKNKILKFFVLKRATKEYLNVYQKIFKQQTVH